MSGPVAPPSGEWTERAIWDAVDAWRWIPPTATRVAADGYELVVTPGSYALTYVYGFRVEPPERADERLEEIRRRIQELGGNGTRFQWTPRSRPADLADRLERHGYRSVAETEVFVWELRDPRGAPRLPDFRPTPEIDVREVTSRSEFEEFLALAPPIFGDPAPTGTTLDAFVGAFERDLRDRGHSDRYLAWEGRKAIGRAAFELAGPVARFWGSGVLESHRGRGVYGTMVRARCEEAIGRGGRIVLVLANVGTSGPILRHHGFRPVGAVRIFEARF